MKRIVITGSSGTIGKVLTKGLPVRYSITQFDLPDSDATDYPALLKAFHGRYAAIHLAWNWKENFQSDSLRTDNLMMISNVYRAAMQCKVKRVIMASSVHADNFYAWKGPGLLSPDIVIGPDSPYGASKIFMETLGRYYAQKGLEVICIRFGGVNPQNSQKTDEKGYEKVWLSHRDCLRLVSICMDASKIPNNFLIIHGISSNKGRVHDYSNPLGWKPLDGSK